MASPRGQVESGVELLCLGFGSRVVGAIWREGDVASNGAAHGGHWLGMSYEHNLALSVQCRFWHMKDSMRAGVVERMSWATLLPNSAPLTLRRATGLWWWTALERGVERGVRGGAYSMFHVRL